MLGHCDIRKTLAIYTHATEGMQLAPQLRLKRPFLEPAVDTSQYRGFGSSVESLYFPAICKTFLSGGTRIRTGDTMIFRFVPKPTVHRHRALWAESKRVLEGTDRRGPPPNPVGRHAVVVGLWWAQRVPNRRLRLCVEAVRHVRLLSRLGVGGAHCPQERGTRVATIGKSFGPSGGTLTQLPGIQP